MQPPKQPASADKTGKTSGVLVEENRFTPFGAIAEDDPDKPVIGAPKDSEKKK